MEDNREAVEPDLIETDEAGGTESLDVQNKDVQNRDAQNGEAKDPSPEREGCGGKAPFVRVKIPHSSETYLCAESEEYQRGDWVLLHTKYGKDLGTVLGPVCCRGKGEELQTVVRRATPEDLELYEANKAREEEALRICREKVQHHKLDMKLVSAHYLPEESKILFFFTAEQRVDFRELVKDLVSVFRMRIELRQIGVRDESRVVGGVAVCGRTYCCHGLTDRLRSVSIKMAKEQNLSLNSMKISGPCGRLLCCLSYEFDFYHEEKRRVPHEGSRHRIGKETFKVTDVNILSKKITMVAMSDGRSLEYPFDRIEPTDRKGEWNFLELQETAEE